MICLFELQYKVSAIQVAHTILNREFEVTLFFPSLVLLRYLLRRVKCKDNGLPCSVDTSTLNINTAMQVFFTNSGASFRKPLAWNTQAAMAKDLLQVRANCDCESRVLWISTSSEWEACKNFEKRIVHDSWLIGRVSWAVFNLNDYPLKNRSESQPGMVTPLAHHMHHPSTSGTFRVLSPANMMLPFDVSCKLDRKSVV